MKKTPFYVLRRYYDGEKSVRGAAGPASGKKKTTQVKMLAKLIVTLAHPHFFIQDLKELDILVRSSAGIVLMYYSFPFVMKKNSDHSAFLGNQSI